MRSSSLMGLERKSYAPALMASAPSFGLSEAEKMMTCVDGERSLIFGRISIPLRPGR